MGAAVSLGKDEPMMDLNMTPLIDVLLVLLIMFIITIPIQTHSVPLDLPTIAPPPNPIREDRNRVAIEQDGRILWNGTPVALPLLRQYLEASSQLRPEPELQLMPHPEARYERVDQVLATIQLSNVSAMGIIGNERYGNF